MKLYTYWRSSAAYRVRIALNLKGIAYESLPVDLVKSLHQAADYLGVNPQGLVPALDTGETVLAQSVAILEYLEEQYPRPPLLPAATIDRAVVRSMVQLIACDIHPLNNLRVLRYLKHELNQDQSAIDAWYSHWIAAGLRSLEALVKTHGADDYCFGETPTLADVCLIPQLYNAHRFECDLEPYPRLVTVENHLLTLPEFAAAVPERQPDAAR